MTQSEAPRWLTGALMPWTGFNAKILPSISRFKSTWTGGNRSGWAVKQIARNSRYGGERRLIRKKARGEGKFANGFSAGVRSLLSSSAAGRQRRLGLLMDRIARRHRVALFHVTAPTARAPAVPEEATGPNRPKITAVWLIRDCDTSVSSKRLRPSARNVRGTPQVAKHGSGRRKHGFKISGYSSEAEMST